MVEFETLKFVAMLDQLVREGVGGVLSCGGDTCILISGKRRLIELPA